VLLLRITLVQSGFLPELMVFSELFFNWLGKLLLNWISDYNLNRKNISTSMLMLGVVANDSIKFTPVVESIIIPKYNQHAVTTFHLATGNFVAAMLSLNQQATNRTISTVNQVLDSTKIAQEHSSNRDDLLKSLTRSFTKPEK